jgi:hypothetical protein
MTKEMTVNMRFFVLILLIFAAANTQAQELIIGLSENPLCSGQPATIRTKSLTSLELPFVDDFSKQGVSVPDTKLWDKGKTVFVNTNYAIDPPTMGVATFDAFDGRGQMYANASSTSVFAADTLLSTPINLNQLAQDSIYLSFYIQPQGYGDMPEESDSLCLEFYSPNNDLWYRVWRTSVISATKLEFHNHLNRTVTIAENDSIGSRFFRIDIKIDQPKFLHDKFRLRFTNHVSISVHPAIAGRSTNADHWHLDYVYLDKNRSATNQNIPDIALVKQQRRLTTNYISVPAAHLAYAKPYLLENPMSLELVYKNFGMGIRSVARSFRLRTLAGSGRTISYSAGAENIADGRTVTLSYPVPQYEFSTVDDSAAIEIIGWIDTDNDPSDFRKALRFNDTIISVYTFKDHYAYDDGTAENGYGLFGTGSANGKVAVKFVTYRADSLRGVYLYFNRTLNDANRRHKFVVAVWDDAGGVPGKIIHRDDGGGEAHFHNELNSFVAYRFSKPVYLSQNEVFYVGWLQTDEGFINIGFDRNTNSREKTFFSIGQNWEQSAFSGSLMLRPIFCRSDIFPSDSIPLYNEPDSQNGNRGSFRAYPNPARSIIYLDEQLDNSPVLASKIELFALSGELLRVYQNVTGSIDLTTIPSGIYLIRVWTPDKRIRETKRIIVVSGQ